MTRGHSLRKGERARQDTESNVGGWPGLRVHPNSEGWPVPSLLIQCLTLLSYAMAVQTHLRAWLRTARNKQLVVAILAVLWVAVVVFTEGTVIVYEPRLLGSPLHSHEIVTETSFLKAVLYCLPALLCFAVMFWWLGLNPRSEKFSLREMTGMRLEIRNVHSAFTE
jgi:hypothetical protein